MYILTLVSVFCRSSVTLKLFPSETNQVKPKIRIFVDTHIMSKQKNVLPLVKAKSLSCKILQDSCKKSLSYKILKEKVYLVRFLQEKVYLVRFLQIHKPP